MLQQYRMRRATLLCLLTLSTHVGAAVPAANVKFDMYSGRLANVPVSSYYASPTINLAADPEPWFFYATCSDQDVDADGGKNVSDVSVILIISDMSDKVVDLKYADSGSPCGYGGDGGGMLYGRDDRATYKYNFLAVSNRRNTALCTIGRANTQILDANGPGTCGLGSGGVIIASDIQVGGTLIKVGPLPEGDTFEVQTPANGRNNSKDRVNMLLLRMDETGTPAYKRGSSGGNGDNDPALTVPRGFADTAENFVLLGKAGRSRDTNEGVETRVDLLHGPLNYVMPGGTFVPTGSVGQYLTPGRWNIEITGKPLFAVGDQDAGQNVSRCDVFASLGSPSKFNRGALNSAAFVYQLEKKRSGQEWTEDTSVAQRNIPLGAFGNAAHLHSLYLNKEVVAIGEQFRPVALDLVGRWTWGSWSVHRNPDNSTIRFVTQNMLYRDFYTVDSERSGMVEDEVNEYKNAAHLFGNRGSITRSALKVSDPTDRGPHEWDADVVVLTEGNDTPGDGRRLAAFINEAMSTGSRSWVGTQQIGEWWPVFTRDSNNMIFVASNVNGGLVCEKDDAPVNQGGCRSRWLADRQNISIKNYVVPGFINARRQIGITRLSSPTRSTPVAVMAVHLDTDMDARWQETASLAAQMKDVLVKNATRVNRNGQRNPLNPGNRFVVIGDVNAQHHKCGESYWLLKVLRNHFGYAVDVAMAMDDSPGHRRHYAMHNRGRTLVDGIPSPYQTVEQWRDLPSGEQWRDRLAGQLEFPWWSGTSPGQTADAESGSHERLDQIWLVGRGWEKDDVGSLNYKVLSAIKATTSPFSPNNGPYGIETWRFTLKGTRRDGDATFTWNSAYRLSGTTSNSATCSATPPYGCDFRPYFGVLGGGTSLGEAAIHTDHLGVMSTIPIFGGAGRR